MTKKPIKKMLYIAYSLVLSLGLANVAGADTVNIVQDGYGAYGTTTFWAADSYGMDAMGGVYQLNKTGSTGIGDTWHNGLIPGFCMELQEPPPHSTTTYSVTMPENVYNSFLGETLGVAKANYLRELWARYYDPSWATTGSHTSEQNGAAQAFAAAVWEIIYEQLPVSPADWDVTLDGTLGAAGFVAQNLDAATANKWLHDLTGSGPKADLRAFVSQGQQDYLVAVPEPATIILLGLGGLCSIMGRQRRMRELQSASGSARTGA